MASYDKVVFNNDSPWAGLGVTLAPGADIDSWRREAGMDFTVATSPVVFTIGKQVHLFKKRHVLYREDDNAPLSVVSSQYKPVQPSEVLEFFREQVEGLGTFTIETAGVLAGGRKIWALAKAKEEIRLGREDVVARYSLLATSYDRSIPTIFQQTSHSVLCENTLMAAVRRGSSGEEMQFRWKHSTTFAAEKLKRALILDKEWARFAEAAGFLAVRKVPSRKVAREYFTNVFFPAPEQAKPDFSVKSAAKRVDRMMDIYEGAPGQSDPARKGTAWGLLNAVTYFVDHEAGARTDEARLDRAWFGSGKALKAVALDLALSMN